MSLATPGPAVTPTAPPPVHSTTPAESEPVTGSGSARPQSAATSPGTTQDTTPDTTPDGRSTRWDSHRAARRIALVHAARKAVHRGGPEISMDEIATYAKTSKSIVYRYFTDKPGLQLAVGEAVVGQMADALREAAHTATTPRDALRSMVAVYLEMIEHSPNVYYFVTRTAPGLPFLDSMIELVAVPFAQEMKASAADAAAWASGAVGFVRGSGEWWLESRDTAGAPTREELTERVTAWLWGGPVGVLAKESRLPH